MASSPMERQCSLMEIRWKSLTATLVAMACSGIHYTWGIYSTDLKVTLGLTQTQLNVLGTAKDFGAFVGYPQGEFYNAYGARLTMLIGSALNFVGFLLFYAKASGLIAGIPYAALVPIIIVASNGTSWFDACVCGSTLQNFPKSTGIAIGVVKSILGLSAALFTCLYVTFLAPHADAFLLLLAFIPGVLGVLVSGVIQVPTMPASSTATGGALDDSDGKTDVTRSLLASSPTSPGRTESTEERGGIVGVDDDDREQDDFLFGLAASFIAILSCYLLLSNLCGEEYEEFIGLVCITFTFLILPYASMSQSRIADSRRRNRVLQLELQEEGKDEDDAANSLLPTALDTRLSMPYAKDALPKLGEDMTMRQALSHPFYWILFTYCSIVFGTGISFINNISQIAIAKGLSRDAIPKLVSLVSVCNCVGRVAYGAASDQLIHRFGVPRPLFFVVSSLLFIVSCGTIAMHETPVLLIPTSIVVGIAYGGLVSLMVSVIGDNFGTKYVRLL